MSKILIVESLNETPEEALNVRLAELGSEWRVVSATTTVAPYGETHDENWRGAARHIYYVTTVVLERVT